MKNTYTLGLTVAVLLHCAPVFAQHGHGAAGPGSMGGKTGRAIPATATPIPTV